MSDWRVWAAVVAVVTTACRTADPQVQARRDSTVLAAREARLDTALADRAGSKSSAPVARWIMPRRLAEISGLALTSDGRLLTHGDETGRVFEIDYRKGVLVKQFSVGRPEVKGDFEAIAVVDSTIYLLTSKGKLYAFTEGKDGSSVGYHLTDTKLGHQCEFEGLAYDPNIKSLLLACKHVYEKKLVGSLVIFRWKLGETGAAALSTLAVPLAQVIGANPWSRVRPSDITVDPKTGNYVLVASLEHGLIVLTPTGQVVSSGPLAGVHPQAEGVAITRDGILIVSDEAPKNGGDASLTLYRWP
jgi:uncharacterized protein YjiK